MSKTNTKYSHLKTRHRAPWYRQPWVMALFIIILIVIVAMVVVFCFKPQSNSSDPQTPTASDQTTTTEESKGNSGGDSTTAIPAPEPEKTTQYEGEDPNTLESLTGSIMRKGIDEGNLVIVAMIDQYLNAPGNCVLVLSGESTGTRIETSTVATADVSTSICGEFIIDAAKLPSDLYKIEIQISGDNKTGVIRDEVRL